jgi:two-component system cell cycle response regulator
MKALVVESSAAVRAMLSQLLNQLDVTVFATASAVEARLLAQNQEYDLACISMRLSDTSGTRLARELRNHNNLSPIVMFTATEDDHELSEALKAGVSRVFNKQDLNGFAEHIRELVYHFNMRRQCGRVLYIDRDRAYALNLRDALKQHGQKVFHVDTLEDAVPPYQNQAFDVLLINAESLPVEQILPFITAIRAGSDAKAHVPIMVLAHRDEATARLALLQAGANDLISTQSAREELIARLMNMIKLNQLITQVTSQQQRLQEIAMTDQLTGLYNRHFLFDCGPRMIAEARRHNHPLSLIVADLDKFKTINDTHGHAMGDLVLRESSQCLKRLCRTEDIPARFGGEEFVIVLTRCTQEDAMKKAEAMRVALTELKPAGLLVSASFGVCEFDPGRHFVFADLFACADAGAYKAKQNGRNRVEMGKNGPAQA